MIVPIVLVLAAVIGVGIMLARQTNKTKKRAIADLEAEKESVGAFDIFELVESEVSALGLDAIEGADQIPHGVLLKIWSDSQSVVDSCSDRSDLRYVVADGVDPAEADHQDVTLECTNHEEVDGRE
jgi:hypothetical protein